MVKIKPTRLGQKRWPILGSSMIIKHGAFGRSTMPVLHAISPSQSCFSAGIRNGPCLKIGSTIYIISGVQSSLSPWKCTLWWWLWQIANLSLWPSRKFVNFPIDSMVIFQGFLQAFTLEGNSHKVPWNHHCSMIFLWEEWFSIVFCKFTRG